MDTATLRASWFCDEALDDVAQLIEDALLAAPDPVVREQAAAFRARYDKLATPQDKRRYLDSQKGAFFRRVEQYLGTASLESLLDRLQSALPIPPKQPPQPHPPQPQDAQAHTGDSSAAQVHPRAGQVQGVAPPPNPAERLRQHLASTRSRARNTRRNLALSLLGIGLLLMAFNPVLIPWSAKVITGWSSDPVLKAVDELEQNLSTFEQRTRLPEHATSIREAKNWLEIIEPSLRKIASTQDELAKAITDFSLVEVAPANGNRNNPDGDTQRVPISTRLEQIASGWRKATFANPLITGPLSDAQATGEAAQTTAEGEAVGEAAEGEPKESTGPRITTVHYQSVLARFVERLATTAAGSSQDRPAVIYPSATSNRSDVKTYTEAYDEYLKALAENPATASTDGITRGNMESILDNLVDRSENYRLEIPRSMLIFSQDQDKILQRIDNEVSTLEKIEWNLRSIGDAIADYAKATEALTISASRVTDIVGEAGTDLTATSPPASGEGDTTANPPLTTAMTLATAVQNTRQSLDNLDTINSDITGLKATVTDSLKNLRSADATLESIRPLTEPYAYVVLALAAMFLTIGLQIVIRWARTADDELDEAKHTWENATISQTIALLHASGIDAETYAKYTNAIRQGAPAPSESLLPSPLMTSAKEGVEIMRAVKSK